MKILTKYPYLKNIDPFLKHLGSRKLSSVRCVLPEHKDANCSAGVYTLAGVDRYHCFACNVDEDSIGLSMSINKSSFRESVKFLSNVYGFSLEDQDRSKFEEQDKVEGVLKSNAFRLDTELSDNALSYLSRRGISKALEHVQMHSCIYHGIECLAFPMGDHSYTLRRLDGGSPRNFVVGNNGLSISLYDEAEPVFVVEGMFDFLSLKEIDHHYNVICLNGVGQYRKCASYLENSNLEKIILFLDPDDIGIRTSKELAPLIVNKNVLNISETLKDISEDINTTLQLEGGTGILKHICSKNIQIQKQLGSVGSKMKEIKISYRKKQKSILSGFKFIDNSGGLDGLVFLGGKPGLGKTTFALQMVSNLLEAGHNIIYYSLEIPEESIIKKLISQNVYKKYKLKIPISDMENAMDRGVVKAHEEPIELVNLLDSEVDRLEAMWGNLHVRCDLHDIESIVANSIGKKSIIFIDHLQEIEKSSSNDKVATDLIVRNLRALRDITKLPVVVLSGSARSTYSKCMDIAMFKDSGSIEYTANMLIGMSDVCDEHNYEKQADTYIEAKILKNRFSFSGLSEIFTFLGDANYFIASEKLSNSLDYECFLTGFQKSRRKST